MPRRLLPVASFGPSIMDTLLAAAKPPGLIIPMPSMDLAMRFRRRIYELRGAMTRENHRDLSIALSVRIYIDKEPLAIRLSPADSEFTDVLHRAHAQAPRADQQAPRGQFDHLINELRDGDDN